MVILIPTCGRSRLLARTLKSLSECELPDAFGETVVVENGPDPAGADVIAPFREQLRARYLYVERANKSHALNRALENVGDGLVVFFDDDIRVEPDILTVYANAARGLHRGRFFGGPTECDYESPIAEWLLEFVPTCTRGWSGGEDGEVLRDGSFLGFNWAAFAEDIRAAGGFDPDFGPGSPTGSSGQENTMQARLREAGVQGVYLEQARVWHYVAPNHASPAWALRRRFRMGIQDALEDGDTDVPQLFGYPRWAVRQWAESLIRIPLAALARDPATRFRPRYDLAHARGYLAGRRMLRRMRTERDGSGKWAG